MTCITVVHTASDDPEVYGVFTYLNCNPSRAKGKVDHLRVAARAELIEFIMDGHDMHFRQINSRVLEVTLMNREDGNDPWADQFHFDGEREPA